MIGLLLSIFAPIFEWFAALRWGQIAATLAPYLFALAVTNPMSFAGLGKWANQSDTFSSSVSLLQHPGLDVPQNIITIANTFFPLSDFVTIMNLLGACWVSRAIWRGWSQVVYGVASRKSSSGP